MTRKERVAALLRKKSVDMSISRTFVRLLSSASALPVKTTLKPGSQPKPKGVDQKLLTERGKYNEELVKAGMLLAAEGLHPSSKGTRVTFSGANRTVIDGSFAETKELIAGFWLWQMQSKEEAIAWVKRCPIRDNTETEIEIRQMFEAEDIAPAFTPELREQEARQRTQSAQLMKGAKQ